MLSEDVAIEIWNSLPGHTPDPVAFARALEAALRAQADALPFSDDEHTLMCAVEHLRAVDRKPEASFRIAYKLDEMRKRLAARPAPEAAQALSDDVHKVLADARWRITNKDTSTPDYQRLDAPVVAAIDAILTRASAATVAEPSDSRDDDAEFKAWREQQWNAGIDPTARDAWMERARREQNLLASVATPAIDYAAQQQAEPVGDEPAAWIDGEGNVTPYKEPLQRRNTFLWYGPAAQRLEPVISDLNALAQWINDTLPIPTRGATHWLTVLRKTIQTLQQRAAQSGQRAAALTELDHNNAQVHLFALEVEKLLCKALGREWCAIGISIETLLAELTGQRAGVAEDARDAARWRAIEPYLGIDDVGDEDFIYGLVVYADRLEEDSNRLILWKNECEASVGAAIDAIAAAPTPAAQGGV